VLAEKIRVVLLGTAGACPVDNIRIVFPFDLLVEEYEPGLLYWDMLASKVSGTVVG